MKLAERKALLEKELEEINEQIRSCNHEYGDIQYDPETVRVPYGCKMTQRGPYLWAESEGYKDEKKDRWSITCRKCGHKKYTFK